MFLALLIAVSAVLYVFAFNLSSDKQNWFSDASRSGSYANGGCRPGKEDKPVDERLKGIDPKMIDLINNEVRF